MRNLLICLSLAALTLAVYWKVRSFGFVNFDDENYVYENARVIHGLNWDNFSYAFCSTEHANYHPLTWLSHELDVSLFGVAPGDFHLENVFIHAANVVLLFLFLFRASGNLKPAVFCAALFAVHPAHVESVAWISERKDVLSGLFFMLALLAYLSYARAAARPKRYLFYGSTLVLFGLGLLAKQTLVTFPFVLLLLDYWPLRRTHFLPGDEHSKNWRSLAIEKIPILFVALAASIVAYFAQRAGGAIVDTRTVPLAERFANAALSYSRYLRIFFWPTRLCVFYPRIKEFSILWVGLSAALVVTITCITFRIRRRAPYFVVGWLLFAGMMVPTIGLVQVGSQSMADRYLYLPMIGLAIILSWGTQDLLTIAGNQRWMRAIATAPVAAILLLMAGMAANQLRYWHDTGALFEHALAVTTDNSVADMQLGFLDARQGNVEGARRYYEEAVRIDPTYFVAQFDLANLLLNERQANLAVAHYQKAFEQRAQLSNSELALLLNNWGIAFLQLNQPGEAFERLQAAEKVDPELANVHLNLGNLLLRAGRPDAAEKEFQRALSLNPDLAGAQRGLAAIRAAKTSTGDH